MYISPGSSTKHRTLAEKQALIMEIERRVKAQGHGVKPVARQLGIAVGSYYRWLREGLRPSSAGVVQVPAANAPAARAPVAPATTDVRERLKIVAAVRAGLGEGIAIKITARQYGITPGIFYRWARDAGRGEARPLAGRRSPSQALVISPPSSPAFRSVTLTAPELPRELSLLAPSGHRVEGLTVESAAALLRALSC